MNAYIKELFRADLYKRTQGRLARQVTFFAAVITLAGGLWRLSDQLVSFGFLWQFFLPLVLGLMGGWTAYRMVNVPSFADFLIAVEAEMKKVSWPTRTELYRSSIVVLVTIFMLGAVLFGFDFYWKTAFMMIGVLPDTEGDHSIRWMVMGLTTVAIASLGFWAATGKSKQ